MGQWKLGYPTSLRSAASEDAGKAAYDGWSISTLVLSSVEPLRTGSAISSSSGATLVLGITLAADSYNGGWCKFRNGDYKGEVYRIYDTTSNSVILRTFAGDTPSFTGVTGDFVEICTGPATYTFPTGKNPVKEDISISTEATKNRYPYY